MSKACFSETVVTMHQITPLFFCPTCLKYVALNFFLLTLGRDNHKFKKKMFKKRKGTT